MSDKPKWESVDTIRAPAPDEIDVDMSEEEDRVTFTGAHLAAPVSVVKDGIANPNELPFADPHDSLTYQMKRLLSEVAGWREERKGDRKVLDRVARSTDRIAQQLTRTADVAQVLMFDRDKSGAELNRIVVMVVEDNEEVLGALESWLLRSNAAPLRARNAAEAREQLRRLGDGNLYAVFIDFVLPDGDGVSLCREIKRLKPKARRIAYTGADDGSIPPGLFHAIINKPGTTSQFRDVLGLPMAAE